MMMSRSSFSKQDAYRNNSNSGAAATTLRNGVLDLRSGIAGTMARSWLSGHSISAPLRRGFFFRRRTAIDSCIGTALGAPLPGRAYRALLWKDRSIQNRAAAARRERSDRFLTPHFSTSFRTKVRLMNEPRDQEMIEVAYGGAIYTGSYYVEGGSITSVLNMVPRTQPCMRLLRGYLPRFLCARF